MKVVFKNPLPAVDLPIRYCKCFNCEKQFRWDEDCMSKITIDDYQEWEDYLCRICSELYEKGELIIKN